MSWQIIDSRDREFRKKEYQIVGINKMTKFLNELDTLNDDEKQLKLELIKDYLYHYPYTCETYKLYNLLDNFFTNLYTPIMYSSLKNMCSNTEIDNAIISYFSL